MSIAPLMLDLEGTELTAEEKELLQHPYCGGLIFFSRNLESIEQLEKLISDIRAATPERILLSVDHEGGRVQRFREGFTRLPALAKLYDDSADEDSALKAAYDHAWLMSSELRAMDINFSFAPVLDLNYGVSEVIGDRAFHGDTSIVERMSKAYIAGMHAAGMAATGKHFPGHGAVVADSHLEIPIDNRDYDTIQAYDMKPFAKSILNGLDAVMPAHVIYPEIDSQPAGFSKTWLQHILREQLAFDGVIFSDDLNMEGASFAGNYAQRAQAALTAGCDMVLVCNNRQGVIEVMDNAEINLTSEPRLKSAQRLERMHGKSHFNRQALLDTARWQDIESKMSAFV